jgi:hypothetical protein
LDGVFLDVLFKCLKNEQKMFFFAGLFCFQQSWVRERGLQQIKAGNGCKNTDISLDDNIPHLYHFCRQVRQSALFKQVVKAKPTPAPRAAAHLSAPCLYHLRAGRRVARARR